MYVELNVAFIFTGSEDEVCDVAVCHWYMCGEGTRW